VDVRVDIEGHGRNSCYFWMTRIRTTIVSQLLREGKEDRLPFAGTRRAGQVQFKYNQARRRFRRIVP
jgi:hypothetical protein